MRTIKFRVWDKDEGVMISPDYIDRNGNAHWKSHSIPESSSEVMQFTGLYDKNGKEIWEGDIVKARSRKSWTEIIGQAVYGDGEYQIETTDNYWPVASIVVLEKLEVIGNIHEHPNLLR